MYFYALNVLPETTQITVAEESDDREACQSVDGEYPVVGLRGEDQESCTFSCNVDQPAQYSTVHDNVPVLENARCNAEQSFRAIYTWIRDAVLPRSLEITFPRQCQRQTQNFGVSKCKYTREHYFHSCLKCVIAALTELSACKTGRRRQKLMACYCRFDRLM